jgi:hypothetical protein
MKYFISADIVASSADISLIQDVCMDDCDEGM